MNQADRVLSELQSGPMRVRELVAITGMLTASCARACGSLVEKGLISRLTGGGQGRPSIYAVRDATAHAPAFRGRVARDAEEAYIDARKAGATSESAAQRLKLTPSTADLFEKAYRLHKGGTGLSTDSSSPKFAKHDEHLSAVATAGVFPDWADAVEMAQRGRV